MASIFDKFDQLETEEEEPDAVSSGTVLQMQNSHSTLFLDAGPSTSICQYNLNATSPQLFKFIGCGPSNGLLYCFDDKVVENCNGIVGKNTANGSPNQYWTFEKADVYGYWYIVSDLNGTVITIPENLNIYTMWKRPKLVLRNKSEELKDRQRFLLIPMRPLKQ